jgi:hypothetical protein
MKNIKNFEDFEWVDAITELEDEDDVSMDTEVEDEFSEKLYNLIDNAKNKLGKFKVLDMLNKLKSKL